MNRDKESDIEQYLTTKQLMDILQISRSSIHRWIEQGMPCIKAGSLNRFSMTEVLDWLGNGQEKNDTQDNSKPTEEKEIIIQPGVYRCQRCGWVGPNEAPRPLSGISCPRCRAVGQIAPV